MIPLASTASFFCRFSATVSARNPYHLTRLTGRGCVPLNTAMNRSSEANTAKAVKDRKCPYCNQDFTSSSLGRHLDLYIRDKNPKAPDGVHDVEAIRKIRQNITRRQPKGSVTRRAVSVSVSGSRQSPEASESPAAMSPLPQTTSAEPQTLSEASRAFPFRTTWEATGVINDLAVPKTGGKSGDVDGDGAGRGPGPAPPQRSAHRHNLKQQLDAKQQIQDAQDTARAAELAFRELLGSLRAAKSVLSPTLVTLNPK